MQNGLASTLVGVLIGIPFGVLASFAAWWFVFHWFTPKLKFSEVVSAIPSFHNPGRKAYRVKFMNDGRRAILDLEVFARLYLPSINARPIENVIDVTVSADRLPFMGPESRPEILRLELHRTAALSSPVLAAAIRGEFEAGNPTLETILSSDAAARIQVLVFGYDEFSGSRKLMCSREYRRADIRDGYFERRRSLEIVPGVPSDQQRIEEGALPVSVRLDDSSQVRIL